VPCPTQRFPPRTHSASVVLFVVYASANGRKRALFEEPCNGHPPHACRCMRRQCHAGPVPRRASAVPDQYHARASAMRQALKASRETAIAAAAAAAKPYTLFVPRQVTGYPRSTVRYPVVLCAPTRSSCRGRRRATVAEGVPHLSTHSTARECTRGTHSRLQPYCGYSPCGSAVQRMVLEGYTPSCRVGIRPSTHGYVVEG
jgi:hypothetical protein